MTSRNQKGFGAIGILLLAVIIIIMASAGWFIVRQNGNANDQPSTPTTRQAAATKSYTDSAKLYSLTYPDNWSVKEAADCCEGEPQDYTKTSRSITLTPTDKADIHGYGLNVQADTAGILAKNIEQNWADNKHTPEAKTINNYNAKYVKIIFNGDAESYVDHNYLLTHEGRNVFLSFREKYYHQYPKADWSASRDMSAFDAIVNSVTFR